MEVYLVCKYIMGSHKVYIISYQFVILISNLKSIDRMYFKNICNYFEECEGTFIVKLMSTYIHMELI